MKRPWRLTIEMGAEKFQREIESTPVSAPVDSPPAPPARSVSSAKSDDAWRMLVDARQKLVDAIANNDDNKVTSTNSWLGGAVAMYAMLTDGDGEEVLARLARVVPAPEIKSPYEGMGNFRQVERKRPAPPPGAPRTVDPSEFTPEEREMYGIPDPVEVEES